MATPNRSAILSKTHKVLKQHYEPILPIDGRSVLEHFLYGTCLENTPYDKADLAFASLKRMFFDWNEVRVTTVTELSEVVSDLSDPTAAASNVKRVLQSLFESLYSFDLEALRKENIGKAVKQLRKYKGATPFAISYVTQNAFGGHSIPVGEGELQTLLVLGVITQAEADKQLVPGMERAIPKSQGVEFGSLLHQLAAEFHASPFSPKVRGVILEIDPGAKQRMPKRGAKKAAELKEAKEKKGDATAKKPSKKETAKKKEPAMDKKKKPDKPAKKKAASTKSLAYVSKKKAKTTTKKSVTKRLAKKKPR